MKGKLSIYSALVSNILIAIVKFIAGFSTNSSSMVSEGIHSLVDTANELLLLYGIKRSQKPPDRERPFGYGKELYFWSFIVAMLIFGLGGGLTIYQGIIHIITPQDLGEPFWNYMVLGFSFVFDGASFIIALRAFNKTRQGLSFWKTIVKTKDPSTFLILFEDGAAVLGVLIVFVLMLLSHALNLPLLDGVASILVGLLLVAVSIIVARESRSLLMGEGITPETQQKISQLAEQDKAVIKVMRILSDYESPEEIVLMLMIRFEPNLTTEEITDAITRIRTAVKAQFSLVEFVIVQPQA